jgi:hypothetical protein
MKAYGEVDNRPMYFWPRCELEVAGQLHHPVALPTRKESSYQLDEKMATIFV